MAVVCNAALERDKGEQKATASRKNSRITSFSSGD